MCNASCIIFGVNNLSREEIFKKRIIEVGSLDLNGSLRPIIEKYEPGEYIGVDIEKGRGVDEICRIEKLVDRFGKDSFDLVVANEILEHVKNWQAAINNIKSICRPGGIIIITTRSFGFPYHAHPHDYWRFEVGDMKRIFSDFEIRALEPDPEAVGVFIKARKPHSYIKKHIDNYRLYSMVTGRKEDKIHRKDSYNLHYFKLVAIEKIKKTLKRLFL